MKIIFAMMLMITSASYLASCSASKSDEQRSPASSNSEGDVVAPPTSGNVNYQEHIVPLLAKYNCLSCHNADGQKPLLDTYEQVVAANAADAVISGRMPPGGMSAEDLATFQAWKAAGYLETASSDAPGEVIACEETSLSTGVRRLSRLEYLNSMDYVLGFKASEHVAYRAMPDAEFSGFNRIWRSLDVGNSKAYEYLSIAETLSDDYLLSGDLISTACQNAAVNDPCVDEFIGKILRRAHRRDVDDASKAQYRGVYDHLTGTLAQDHLSGLRAVVDAVLQSPRFLYRTELGDAASGSIRSLDGWEIASLMSYFILSSPPDEALLQAAASGKLLSAEGRRAEANRLLATADAKASFSDFVISLLEVRDLPFVSKSAALFPEFNQQLVADAFKEIELSSGYALEAGLRPADLISGRQSFVNSRLASIYGVSAGSSFARTSLPEGRSGLLTSVAFLASHSHSSKSSPILRGKTIARNLSCANIPSPPPDVPTEGAGVDVENMTTREIVEAHSSNPSCRGCHQIIDPYGFSLEHFDPIGQFRSQDNGMAVDASSETFFDGVKVAFNNASEMGQALAPSADYNQCFTSQLSGFAFGIQKEENSCFNQGLYQQLGSQASIKDIILEIVASDYFVTRKFAE